MKRKLKAIWKEIVMKWILLTFLPKKMEKQRMQIIAQIVDRKDTLWSGIPIKPRTILEILSEKLPETPIKRARTYNEMVLEEYKKKKSEIDKALFEALQEIEKQKQNGNSKETTNSEQEKIK